MVAVDVDHFDSFIGAGASVWRSAGVGDGGLDDGGVGNQLVCARSIPLGRFGGGDVRFDCGGLLPDLAGDSAEGDSEQVLIRCSWGSRLFSILKDRDTGVYFLTAFLFSIPLAAYYPYSAKFLKNTGSG